MNARTWTRTLAVWLTCAGAIMTPGCALPAEEAEDAEEEVSQEAFSANAKYNEISQKSSHNSYDRNESLTEQLRDYRIRSLELDIHHSNNLRNWPDLDRDWYVYHAALLPGSKKEKKLSSMLQEIKAWHDSVRGNHDVVTIWVDLKDDFRSAHHQTDEDFDRLLVRVFGRDHIFARSDYRTGFPTMKDLWGKFIFVLTDRVGSYNNSLAFEASSSGVFRNYDEDTKPAVVDAAQKLGLATRVYVLNNKGDWNGWKKHRVNHLATNKINMKRDSWARAPDLLR